MKKSKKIVIGVLCGVALALVLVTGGILLGINFNVSTAPTVEVFDNGKMVMLTTQASTDYKGYRFRFKTDKDTFYIDSKDNNIILSQNQQIIMGTTYKIAVCYLGEIEGSNSKYSKEIDWTAYDYLATPVVSLNEEEDKLTWNSIENATSYLVYYGNESIETIANEISLQNIPSGQRQIFVVANSSSKNYLKSQRSNVIDCKVVYQLKQFETFEFNREQFLVTLTGRENLSEFNIYVNEQVYKVVEFVKQPLIGGGYKYTFNINGIYKENAKLGVAPISSEFEKFNGEILYYEAT